MVTKREILEYYERGNSQPYPSLQDIEQSKFKASEVASLLGTTDFSSILDLGCGFAGVSKELTMKCGCSFSIGCDLSGSLLRYAKEMNADILLINADCEQLPIRDRSVETVLLIDLLEHLPNPEKLVAEVERVVTKRVVIRTPIDDCLYHRLKKPKWLWIAEWKLHCGHLQKFNLSQLVNLICLHDLNILKIAQSKPPFNCFNVERSLIFKFISFILPKLLPFKIYIRLFPCEVIVLAQKKVVDWLMV